LFDDDERMRELEERYEGYEVYDRNGEKIGKVDDLFVDETDREEYIGVKMGLFGLSGTTMIPMDIARVNETERTIEVAETKEHVKDAPNYSDEDDIDLEFEARIRDHFGLEGMEASPERGTYGSYPGATAGGGAVSGGAVGGAAAGATAGPGMEREPGGMDRGGDLGGMDRGEPRMEREPGGIDRGEPGGIDRDLGTTGGVGREPGSIGGEPGGMDREPGGIDRGEPGGIDRDLGTTGGADRDLGRMDREPGGIDRGGGLGGMDRGEPGMEREPGGIEREPGGVGREPGGIGGEPGGMDREPSGIDRDLGGMERGDQTREMPSSSAEGGQEESMGTRVRRRVRRIVEE